MHSRLVIEKIGSEESLRSSAVAEDLAVVEHFANPRRRCEALAWRNIVRRELGRNVKISYDEYGAPLLDIPNIYIGVSHSKEDVAVLFAQHPCAVDIETTNRNFRSVASRYLSTRELALAEQYDLFAEMWSAKEALYKFYKKGGVDFVRDVAIESYSPTEKSFVATILDITNVVVKVKREDNLVIAVIG